MELEHTIFSHLESPFYCHVNIALWEVVTMVTALLPHATKLLGILLPVVQLYAIWFL